MKRAAFDSYEVQRKGEWKLLVRPERWDRSLWVQVLEILTRESPARHPSVQSFYGAVGNTRDPFYLKIYYCLDVLEKMKSLFRDSKAFRALKLGEALQRERFSVPLVVAAGEERKRGILKRAFLLTLGVEGLPLPVFLQQYHALPPHAVMIKQKREHLNTLATEVSRLHRLGFVHGDLTPYNLLVHADDDRVSFFLMDNDRTRRYPAWFPQRLWKRNLLQLNRFKLPAISLQDRVRFLRRYLQERCQREREIHLLHWLEEHTRKRRAWKDRFRGEVSFRELMRWDGVFSKKTKLNG